MIVVVAPYSPPNRVEQAHLGASRKLETIIIILSRLNLPLVLVNSAHNGKVVAPLSMRRSHIGNFGFIEITPSTLASSLLGKMENIFEVDHVLDEIKKLGTPQLIWFYNGYAFEMQFALKSSKRFNVPMVLEFEDWHFSRSRYLNPKPFIDYFLWRIAAPYMTATFAVNSFLASKMKGFGGDIKLLPGVVPADLSNIANKFPPFSSLTGVINIGFFGGLSAEKGADIVLQLSNMLPPEYVLHVTGAGPLEAEFDKYAKMQSERLIFYGRVDNVTLYELIAKCDVILNPHMSIEKMNNGVFPFKVIEAIAGGRLLISTTVPLNGLEDLMAGTQFVEHTVAAFADAILVCRENYLLNAALISQCAVIAQERFDEESVLAEVKKIMKSHGA